MPPPPLPGIDSLVFQALLSSSDKPFHGLAKLQKLLFIAAHPKEFDLSIKRPIRALRFKVYKHGPFCEEIVRALTRMETTSLVTHTQRLVSTLSGVFDEPDVDDDNAPPRTLNVYETARGATLEALATDDNDLRLVKEAASKWGWLSPGQIDDFVNRRTGFNPDLRERYFNTLWEEFVKSAGTELRRRTPEPTEAFWKSEQAFREERAKLLSAKGQGAFVAYIDGKRIAAGPDDAKLFDEVSKAQGSPPDFIGFLSASGVRSAAAPAAV